MATSPPRSLRVTKGSRTGDGHGIQQFGMTGTDRTPPHLLGLMSAVLDLVIQSCQS